MVIFSVDSALVVDWLISFCTPEVAKDSVWFGRLRFLVLGSEVSSTASDSIAVVTTSEDARDKGAGEELVATEEEDSVSTKLSDVRVVDSVDGAIEMVVATLSVSVSSCLVHGIFAFDTQVRDDLSKVPFSPQSPSKRFPELSQIK